MIRNNLTPFILSVICYFAMGTMRGMHVEIGGSALSSMIGFVIMFLITSLSLKKTKKTNALLILFSIWLGISIIEIPARILIDNTLFTLPTYLYWCIGILFGYCFWKFKRVIKIVTLIISLILVIIAPKFYGYWTHKYNFATFTGKLELVMENPIIFQRPQGEDFSTNDLKGQYVILDFWYTRCGICYQEFPNIQELYDEYKNNSFVSLYAVHCRMENETFGTGASVLDNKEYTFPCLSIDIDDLNLKKIGINVYPTVIILNPEGTIVFRGRTEFAKCYIENLKSIIDQ